MLGNKRKRNNILQLKDWISQNQKKSAFKKVDSSLQNNKFHNILNNNTKFLKKESPKETPVQKRKEFFVNLLEEEDDIIEKTNDNLTINLTNSNPQSNESSPKIKKLAYNETKKKEDNNLTNNNNMNNNNNDFNKQINNYLDIIKTCNQNNYNNIMTNNYSIINFHNQIPYYVRSQSSPLNNSKLNLTNKQSNPNNFININNPSNINNLNNMNNSPNHNISNNTCNSPNLNNSNHYYDINLTNSPYLNNLTNNNNFNSVKPTNINNYYNDLNKINMKLSKINNNSNNSYNNTKFISNIQTRKKHKIETLNQQNILNKPPTNVRLVEINDPNKPEKEKYRNNKNNNIIEESPAKQIDINSNNNKTNLNENNLELKNNYENNNDNKNDLDEDNNKNDEINKENDNNIDFKNCSLCNKSTLYSNLSKKSKSLLKNESKNIINITEIMRTQTDLIEKFKIKKEDTYSSYLRCEDCKNCFHLCCLLNIKLERNELQKQIDYTLLLFQKRNFYCPVCILKKIFFNYNIETKDNRIGPYVVKLEKESIYNKTNTRRTKVSFVLKEETKRRSSLIDISLSKDFFVNSDKKLFIFVSNISQFYYKESFQSNQGFKKQKYFPYIFDKIKKNKGNKKEEKIKINIQNNKQGKIKKTKEIELGKIVDITEEIKAMTQQNYFIDFMELQNLPYEFLTFFISEYNYINQDTYVDKFIKEFKIPNKEEFNPLIKKEIEIMFAESNKKGNLKTTSISENFNFNCPFSSSLMNIPVKGKYCSHLKCFELKNFLHFIYTSNNRCPICNKFIFKDDLVIGFYLLQKLMNKKEENKYNENYLADYEETVNFTENNISSDLLNLGEYLGLEEKIKIKIPKKVKIKHVKTENENTQSRENKSDDKSTDESLININVDNNISKDNNLSLFEDNSDKDKMLKKKRYTSININEDKNILNTEEESEYNINEINEIDYNPTNDSRKEESNKSLSFLVPNITNQEISLDYDDL